MKRTRAQADPQDVDSAAEALLDAERPVILAGAGVLYAEATDELRELAELLQIPVLTTMEGKSAISESEPPPGPRRRIERHERPRLSFPERRRISCSPSVRASPTTASQRACPAERPSSTRRTIPVDLNKNYAADHPVLGDAKLVLRQFIECCADRVKGHG